jgi:hypothetical protein
LLPRDEVGEGGEMQVEEEEEVVGDMMESVLMAPGLSALRDRFQRSLPLRMHREATRLYDLLLTTGVSPGDAHAKVAELYSPPRVTVELGRLPHLSLKGGSTF